MNDFLNRMRLALSRFMQGRHGADELGLFSLIASVAVSLLARLLNSGLLSLLGLAGYALTIWRMLSRDDGKRRAENQKYLAASADVRQKGHAFLVRQKNKKEYKYFRCPGCHALIRLKRGTGEVDVTCPRCQKKFHQKA